MIEIEGMSGGGQEGGCKAFLDEAARRDENFTVGLIWKISLARLRKSAVSWGVGRGERAHMGGVSRSVMGGGVLKRRESEACCCCC